MASSSVSQEDLENDFEISSRRSRIRSARARTTNANTPRIDPNMEGDEAILEMKGGEMSGAYQGDHDASPKPLGRCKEKRNSRCAQIRQPLADHINRANHMNKGKQRDRRKLREKRRSTGVVHLQSTESTGGSTGEDEDEVQLSTSLETKNNTLQNEQLTDLPDRGYVVKHMAHRRTKNPSDFDADDEDNQNQSDSAGYCYVQQRPGTPTIGEAVEERLERAQAENRRLLSLLEERDRKISALESKILQIQTESGVERTRFHEEIDGLIHVVNTLKYS